MIYEFYEFGFFDLIVMFVEYGIGVGDVLDVVVNYFDKEGINEIEESIIKVVIIGKLNIGKFFFVNYIFGEERVIVSDIFGIMCDVIDFIFEFEGIFIILIDMVGFR